MDRDEQVIRFNEGSKIHNYLIKKIAEDFIKKGYKVYTNYWVTIEDKRMKIDVVAIGDNKKIAAECYTQPQLKYILRKIRLLKKYYDEVIIVVPDTYYSFYIHEENVYTKHYSITSVHKDNINIEELEELKKKIHDYEAKIHEYKKIIEELRSELNNYNNKLNRAYQIFYLLLQEYDNTKKGKIAKFQVYSESKDTVYNMYLFIDNKTKRVKVLFLDDKTKKWLEVGQVVKIYIDNKFVNYSIEILDDRFKEYEKQINTILEELKYKLSKLEKEYGLIFDIKNRQLEFTTADKLYYSTDSRKNTTKDTNKEAGIYVPIDQQ